MQVPQLWLNKKKIKLNNQFAKWTYTCSVLKRLLYVSKSPPNVLRKTVLASCVCQIQLSQKKNQAAIMKLA